jgi:NitT/TauT family transport system substrate-binding protein
MIDQHPELVQELVDGINGSGLWLEKGVDNRFSAAEVVGKYYYNQKPELLKFVLSKPVDRVRYDQLTPLKGDFEEIVELGLSTGMFKERPSFESYCDTRFATAVPNVPVAMPPDDGKGIPGGGVAPAEKKVE